MNQEFMLDVSGFPNELKLLLSIVGPAQDSGRQEYTPVELSHIDWGYFLQLAKHHRVYPLLYCNLTKWNIQGIPNEVMQALSQEYRKNTFLMMHLSREMQSVCKSLEEQNIRTLMLKGPTLAEALYGNVALRTSKDLDILVPIQDVERAEEILFANGYVVLHEKPRILNDWQWRDHHASYVHPQKKITIEMHWRLNPDSGYEPDFEELWAKKDTNHLTGYPIYILGSEHLYFYLVSHGARHGWFRLRWLIDIDRVVRKGIQWNTVSSVFEKYQSSHLLGQSIILISRLFHTPISLKVQSLAAASRAQRLTQDSLDFIQDIVNLCPVPATKELAKKFDRYLFSMKSTSQKWKFLISRLYPRSSDAKEIPLPKYLHFIYFILRPFQLIWRRFRQHPHEG